MWHRAERRLGTPVHTAHAVIHHRDLPTWSSQDHWIPQRAGPREEGHELIGMTDGLSIRCSDRPRPPPYRHVHATASRQVREASVRLVAMIVGVVVALTFLFGFREQLRARGTTWRPDLGGTSAAIPDPPRPRGRPPGSHLRRAATRSAR
ncbi:hypothetical protein FAIPA1_540015 [Frankia sp. AiPs1]